MDLLPIQLCVLPDYRGALKATSNDVVAEVQAPAAGLMGQCGRAECGMRSIIEVFAGISPVGAVGLEPTLEEF